MKGTRLDRWMQKGVVAAALFLAGCGETPLSPVNLMGPGMSATTTSPEGAARFGTGTTGATTVLTEAQVDVLLGGAPVVASSASVVGTNGGTVTCGHFTVTVPPGAFRGTAVVTARMSTPSSEVVDLAISPASLNGFRKDVALTFNPAGLTSTDSLTIFWYDPSTKTWTNLGATVDPRTGLTTALLKHFSVYRAGKVGW